MTEDDDSSRPIRGIAHDGRPTSGMLKPTFSGDLEKGRPTTSMVPVRPSQPPQGPAQSHSNKSKKG